MDERGREHGRHDDDALMAKLSAMLARVDPGPPTHEAKALLTWRTIDAEVTELLGAGSIAAPRFPR